MPLKLPAGYQMRAMKDGEQEALWQIDCAAAQRFADHGFPSLAQTSGPPPHTFLAVLEGRGVWVVADATDIPVGFAVAGDLEGLLWLYEMGVHPSHGKKGIGKALLSAVIDHGKWAFYGTMGLSTFRNVPFNEPFYAKFGFMRVDPLAASSVVCSQFEGEIPEGVHPASRILMIRKL